MEHYFSKKPKARQNIRTINYKYEDHFLTFQTSSSVFSRKAVDKGTDLLIKKAIVSKNAHILDIGCGYGIIGIAISMANPCISVTMSDINERAVSLAKKNLKLNKASATVLQSDLFQNITGKFHTILTNPPQSAGKKLCFRLIEESKAHLCYHGSLQLVARHNKGGKELSRKMHEVFGNVDTIARASGYHLYYSEKK